MTPKITITDSHGVGDLNALIGDRVVAVAFVSEGKWRIYDIIRGGGPTVSGLTLTEVTKELVRVAKEAHSYALPPLRGNEPILSEKME